MNDTVVQHSLRIIENLKSHTSEGADNFNIWLWIAIAEFVIIVLLILFKMINVKPSKMQLEKEEAINKEVDFSNIINSSFNSTELYKVLIGKCHPDKFATDPYLNAIADKLFQEITQNKTNVKRLEEIKKEAKDKLKINF